ncbi:hypothetical protein AB0N17_33585 [Streptomyces sp. NPDC051133]|uniref:hypothetical protein n=1 Tax=Streptomyces sp. NPDC051133 TaxID=3155521 RepID=UPI00343ECFA0
MKPTKRFATISVAAAAAILFAAGGAHATTGQDGQGNGAAAATNNNNNSGDGNNNSAAISPRLKVCPRRRGRGAGLAAVKYPAHLIVFDALEAAGTVLMVRPYRERRDILKGLFSGGGLVAPVHPLPGRH